MTYPDCCQHRFTFPAKAKALPHEGALTLVARSNSPVGKADDPVW